MEEIINELTGRYFEVIKEKLIVSCRLIDERIVEIIYRYGDAISMEWQQEIRYVTDNQNGMTMTPSIPFKNIKCSVRKENISCSLRSHNEMNYLKVELINGKCEMIPINYKIFETKQPIGSLDIMEIGKEKSFYQIALVVSNIGDEKEEKKNIYLSRYLEQRKKKISNLNKKESNDGGDGDGKKKDDDDDNESKDWWELAKLNRKKNNYGELMKTSLPSCIYWFDSKRNEEKLINLKLVEMNSGHFNLNVGKCIVLEEDILLFNGYLSDVMNLGLIYCPIRKSGIFMLNCRKNFLVSLSSDDDKCIYQFRYHHPTDTLIWLENNSFGEHLQQSSLKCSRDVLRNFKEIEEENEELKKCGELKNEIKTVIDNEKDREKLMLFIVMNDLPVHPFRMIKNELYLFLTILKEMKFQSFFINLKTGQFSNINQLFDIPKSSNAIADMNGDRLVILEDEFNKKPIANLYGFDENNKLELLKKNISNESNLNHSIRYRSCETSENIQYLIVDGMEVNDGNETFNKIKYRAEKSLIVLIHGGPHSSVVNCYSPFVHFFTSLGFRILMPNYRGSIGHSYEYMNSLPGSIGSMDVEDVIDCLQHYLISENLCENSENFQKIIDGELSIHDGNNPLSIHLCGGSHGGFLVTWLAGKYPNLFDTCIARNPVVHLPSMLQTSDIPDWVLYEVFKIQQNTQMFDDNLINSLSNEQIRKLELASPTSQINNIRCRTVMQIGMEDARVPPSQGINFMKRLALVQNRNGNRFKKCLEDKLKMFKEDISKETFQSKDMFLQTSIYPSDSHPLSRMDTRIDCDINTTLACLF
ncbi:hypothetical protein SNEBB_000987 [Seison nebaliae]|nr:hypothetical protein SNEBB_000987 [Seison nebaliae]